jgi:hypothetical protein
MHKLVCTAAALWAAAALTTPIAARAGSSAQQAADRAAAATDGPAYNAAGELVRPADYREWVFVSSGLGMTYGPAQPPAAPGADTTAKPPREPMFDNVFVTRDAYRAFLNTGIWPDQTMFVLEIRRSLANVSINNGGRTQGEVAVVEAAVKDVQRYKATGGWAYFDFGGGERARSASAPLPATASCYNCHATNTAVENTFVQFYPELLAAARKHGSLKPGH